MNVQFGQAVSDRRHAQQTMAVPVPASKEQLRLRLSLGLAFVDLGAILLGFLVGSWVRFGAALDPRMGTVLFAILPIYYAMAVNGRAYGAEILASPRRSIVPAVGSLFAGMLALLFVGYLLKANADVSRVMVLVSTAAAAMLLAVGRLGYARFATARFGGAPMCRVLILDGVAAAAAPGMHVVEAADAGLVPDVTDPMMLDRLGRFLKGADKVIIACPPERRVAWSMAMKGTNVRGELIMPEVATIGPIGTSRFGADTTLIVSAGTLGTRQRAMKRLLDLGLALGALAFLAPLLLVVAVLIRLDSPGPALFVQHRLGRGNRLFAMYKFRSMRADLCDARGDRSTGREDDRITRIGRFIRATSIDELPQLLNILKGDMSFVGPRPHALGSLAGDQLFWEIDKRYWHRHASKPGLTGLAQVRGFRGATHRRSDLVARLQADLEYLNDWTILRDISILFATLKVVVHKNAY